MTPDATDTAEPRYRAVPGPFDSESRTYWYRVKKGYAAGQLSPWPRRERYGVLWKKQLPGLTHAEAKGLKTARSARVREARAKIQAAIEADPQAAATRFAVFCIRCCCCGTKLTDKRSKICGVGADCRRGMNPAMLAWLAEHVRRLHALHLTTQGITQEKSSMTQAPSNETRAAYGFAAIQRGSADVAQNDAETGVVDMLANVMHYFAGQGINFQTVATRAVMHFTAEHEGREYDIEVGR